MIRRDARAGESAALADHKEGTVNRIHHPVAAATLLAGGLAAQTVGTLAQSADVVTGVGSIESLQNAVISDEGTWIMRCDTDASPGFDSVALENGLVILREGDVLSDPPNATLLEIVDWEVDRHSNLIQKLRISLEGESLDALYWNRRLLALENTPLGTFDPGTRVWREFVGFRTDAANRVLILANVIESDEIGLPVPGEDTLVLFELDPAGNVVARSSLVVEGADLPGLPSPVDRFPADANSSSIAINRHGEFLWSPLTADGTQYLMVTTEQVVSHTDLGFNDPTDPNLDGRRILDFQNFRGDINDMGDFAYSCRLHSLSPEELLSDWILTLNNEKFVQEADVLPSLGGAVLDEGGDAPVHVTNNQMVYWQANLRGTGAGEDRAFMRGHDVIVHKGQTVLDGKLVTEIDTSSNAFSVSSDGRFWVGRVTLENSGDALAYADFGLAVPLPGRRVNEGLLCVVSGNVLVGQQLTLHLDRGPSPGAFSFLLFSSHPAIPGSETGILVDYGEILLGLPYHYMIPGPIWSGAGIETVEALPSDPALVNTTWYGQAAYLDLTPGAPERIRLTNGLRIEIGQS